MKKSYKYIGLGLVVLFIIALFMPSDNESKSDSKRLSFKQVGYLKTNDNTRYKTFYIPQLKGISQDSISQEIFDIIEEHGSSLQRTEGKLSASFYYTDSENTPDISLMSVNDALDLVHELRPIASSWNFPNGNSNFIKNPNSEPETE